MSSSNCWFLTYIQISQEAGRVVWYSHLFQNFLQFAVIHTGKGFAVVNNADVFLRLSCFFDVSTDVSNLISGSSPLSKSCLSIWKFIVYALLKPDLENFEHYFTSMWDGCGCAVIWAFFGMAFFGTESHLDCKEIQPVHSEGDQPWDFFGRNGAKAETPVLWPPLVKSWLTGKDPDPGKDWRQEEKGMTEYEMAGWHHWLNVYEFEQTLGDSKGQGSLECCSTQGHKKTRLSDSRTTKILSFPPSLSVEYLDVYPLELTTRIFQ